MQFFREHRLLEAAGKPCAETHLAKAAEHAAAAGDEWDEEKHPRDNDGKFA